MKDRGVLRLDRVPWRLRNQARVGAALALIVAVGMVAVLMATETGPGLREDSYSYVTAADSLAAGTGLGRWAGDGTFRPLLHFPPLFPFVLALFKLGGLEVLSAIRWFHAVLFGLTALLAGIITKRLSGSVPFSALSCGLVLASPSLIEAHSWLHSEPLYLFLMSLTLLALGEGLSRPHRSYYSWLAGGAAALALLDRFAGISLVFAGCVLFLVQGGADRRGGVRKALVFSGVAVLPTAVFAIGNYLAYGNALDRPAPAWHPPPLDSWAEGASAVLGWVFPQRIVLLVPLPAMLLLGLGTLVLVGAVMSALYGHLRTRQAPAPVERGRWVLLLAFVFTSYLVVLLVTILFFDRLTPLNDRILSPLYLAALPAVVAGASELWARQQRPPVRGLILGLIILAGLTQAYRGFGSVQSMRLTGLGLSSVDWRRSPTIAHVRSLPAVPLYSNNLPALYFLANRNAMFVPSSWNAASDQPRSDYQADLARMRSDLRCRGALLVIVGSHPSGRLPAGDRGEILEGLALLVEFEDGQIYGAAPDSCSPKHPQSPG